MPLFVVGSTLPPPGAASVSDTHISQSGGPGGLVSEVLEFTRRSHVCGTLAEMHVGERESICGWVASQRSHGSVTFVNAMRDHTGIVQVTNFVCLLLSVFSFRILFLCLRKVCMNLFYGFCAEELDSQAMMCRPPFPVV